MTEKIYRYFARKLRPFFVDECRQINEYIWSDFIALTKEYGIAAHYMDQILTHIHPAGIVGKFVSDNRFPVDIILKKKCETCGRTYLKTEEIKCSSPN